MANELGGSTRRHLKVLFELGSPAGLTDGQLLERFAGRRGEWSERAFEVLVERHGSMVLRACRGILRDDHEAMDAYQATFLVLARKGSSLWVRDSIGPWLHRVACRAAGRARSEAGRRRSIEERAAEVARARRPVPGRDEFAGIVHEEVDRLPGRYREPIVLCDLEGYTCEEAARHLGCPVGTVGSRLARGREKLRGRLARRGLSAGSVALLGDLPGRAAGAGAPAAITKAAIGFAAKGTTAGLSSTAAVRLAEDVLRSLLMSMIPSAAALVAVASGALMAGGVVLAVVHPQDPAPVVAPAGAEARRKIEAEEFDRRHRDYLMAAIGNLPPPAEGGEVARREVILYKDGSAKFWSNNTNEFVGPPLRHAGPIREVGFREAAGLLFTSSGDSVKVWDGASGVLRREIAGQIMRPCFTVSDAGPGRFATVDPEGRTATLWDAATLEPTATIRPEGAARLIGAIFTRDGRTLVTIGEDRSITLREPAEGKPFATLRLPSPPAVGAFYRSRTWPDGIGLDLGDPFFQSIKPLLPVPAGPTEK